MKLRPLFQLRFEDLDQYLAVKNRAGKLHVSMNAWVLSLVQVALDSASGNTRLKKEQRVREEMDERMADYKATGEKIKGQMARLGTGSKAAVVVKPAEENSEVRDEWEP